MLTADERSAFDRLGIVRLAGAIPRLDAERMRQALWADLGARHGIRPERRDTWAVARPSSFQRLVRTDAFAAMACSAAREALDDVLGSHDWGEPPHWGTPLVTFPAAEGHWEVPHQSWHIDAPADRSAAGISGVVVFAHLADVEPHGGGTVVVTGSHLLVSKLACGGPSAPKRSAEMRKALARAEPWLRALFSGDGSEDRERRFMEEGVESNGCRLQVAELVGEAGDITLMDMRIVHAAAPNFSSSPRLMLVQQICRGGLLG